jgi:hypothetical protein
MNSGVSLASVIGGFLPMRTLADNLHKPRRPITWLENGGHHSPETGQNQTGVSIVSVCLSVCLLVEAKTQLGFRYASISTKFCVFVCFFCFYNYNSWILASNLLGLARLKVKISQFLYN